MTEGRDHTDDAQGHRAAVISEGEGAAHHTPLGGGEDHEWLVGGETFNQVVDPVVSAVDRLGQLRPGQVEHGPELNEVAHGAHFDRRGTPRPLRAEVKTAADLRQRLMSAQGLRSQ